MADGKRREQKQSAPVKFEELEERLRDHLRRTLGVPKEFLFPEQIPAGPDALFDTLLDKIEEEKTSATLCTFASEVRVSRRMLAQARRESVLAVLLERAQQQVNAVAAEQVVKLVRDASDESKE